MVTGLPEFTSLSDVCEGCVIWPGSKNGSSKCIFVDFDGGDDEEKQQSIENVQQQLDMDEQQLASTSNALKDAQSPAEAKEDEQRSQRVRKRPSWMTDYEVTGIDHSEDTLTHFSLFFDCYPIVFEEVAKESKWQKAMDEEIAAIERNNTWELTELPKGKKGIGVKWVYKTNLKENGEIEKYKAHLVTKGYKQEFGIDYKEVYAPVARHDMIHLVIALAAQNSWPLYQLDLKSTFLHGDLDEEVFIHQPPGYIKVGNEHKVYKLKRALYGLKQAPQAWYSRIESYFLKKGFEKCPYEHTLFIKSEGGKMLIVCLYVDDLIYTGNDMVMFDKFKKSMMAEFEMSDLGLMHYYLGIEVKQSDASIFISQKKYVQDILDRFRMKNSNPVSTPIEPSLKLVRNPRGKEINSTLCKQIVGTLMYLTATRPDIMHAVSLINRYMDCLKEVHLVAAKRILRYLQGTVEYGLFYKNGEKSELFRFTNSDFARDLDDRKSTSSYVFIMGTTAISWTSRKQSIVTLSTTEAEFVAATTCACQAICLRKVLEELQSNKKGSYTRKHARQRSEITAPQLRDSEFIAPQHLAESAHYVTIIGLIEPRGCGQATTIWRRINSKRKLKDIQQLHWHRLWENEQKSSLEVKMVHTRTTQRGSPPQGQGRGQPPSVNLVSQNVPIAAAQHQQVEGVEEHNPQYPNAVASDPAQNASNALMCKMFPSTLRGNARTWYHTLRPNSINAYAELATSFATKFSSRRLIKKTTPKLMRITQRDGESLKNYMNRFNDAMLEVNAFDEAVGITAVIQGLNHDRFRDNLIKHTPTTFDEVNQRSLKFIKVEEPIYGFNNQPVPVEGVLRLNVAFGSGRMYVTPSVRFLIGTKLTPIEKQELVGFLKANKDVFAWTSADMPGIPTSVAVHKLSISPLRKLVAQKRRLFGGERLTASKEEVKKLLQAGFIRRVDYCEWIANPVMVKKSNGKWRMCIDYTNLNDACPEDCHPMLSIDKLVEAASGNERLSLLYAYSGYHQVRMAPEDEVKTSFYAGDEIYCYVMMPFGLKNAGATYQKIVTIVFRAQIGRNLEVYVDDIVVKSSRAEDHLTDLTETFNNLRSCSMKLNPAKCTFGVELGKFLGFMVSRRGIEVNPEKIKAIEEMKSPRSTKDVQRLVGRIAALHRFISKSTDKCLPFFKVLRTAAQKDETGKPQKEMGKQQQLVYYASKVLQGAEQRYPIVEKAALAVVKPECFGRLIKWAVELREFQIAFQQRSAIRAQALVDFVVEYTSNQVEPNSEVETWTLYVDGSSNSKGSGAGAVLTGPDSFWSRHALKFNFEATNNVAEYRALLLGMRLAAELKVKRLQIYSDSQLVVNQINSMCEVIDPILAKYVAAVSELKNRFEKFQLTKIPRAENEHADSLLKLASENSREAKSMYIEILNEPSFQTSGVMEISTDPDALSWTDPIREYLLNGTVPGDKQEEMKLRRKASRYTLVGDILYKRSYSLPLLKCLTPYEAEYALREVHEGVCGSHVGARTLAHKPTEELTSMIAPWPFSQWGIDLLGPFVKAIGGATHLVVVVDYFTKWVEAKPLSCLTSRRIEDFLFSSVICRYGIPNQIIADNGPQFNCNSFRDFCSSYGIKLVFTSVYHPEANGMVESVNKAILEGIKPRLDQLKTKWVDELNNVLWAYRTTSRTATGETPYHLAFGTEAVIPVKIGVPSLRINCFEPVQNERLLRENLDFLDEVREQSRLRTLAYKQRIANLYNKRVRPRNFKVGDLVLRKVGLTGFET
ncbi:hypothetical protein SLEP1_g7971 [Rubroshorea leprosula]|uniref:Uncharacterized protein n=1 Tax=Rubroshorea leprosula TaxID=152421 RepID=A0AAV5I637_9ROSI|nr:hypothetical protein SLEP1_g7971 [Rubroshorea leprosula]